jgi:hypothetical protein
MTRTSAGAEGDSEDDPIKFRATERRLKAEADTDETPVRAATAKAVIFMLNCWFNSVNCFFLRCLSVCAEAEIVRVIQAKAQNRPTESISVKRGKQSTCVPCLILVCRVVKVNTCRMDTFRYLLADLWSRIHLLTPTVLLAIPAQYDVATSSFVCFGFVDDSLVTLYEYSDNLIGRMSRLICD